ncbi:DUF2382 domain-containing protein [Phormidium sp. CLA17]|uniref:DUF2382 domain-containing protein n=1 Tax=Leptolyngbya sp. Cla-17 TaxID=2803751 RepID=UPI00149218D0|nr:DUF2382 domain-containing protein [Leptolyngbya sp. Cla-17]MBM0741999.1 DUF2382 domain-containing protein [Leptolyngbya sp. Cla-17]
MPLHKIKDFDPDYRTHFDDQDIVGYDLYAGKDKVGSVDDLLVDDSGKLRYLIINTGTWILGKKVLLPIGRSRIDYKNHRITAEGLTRSQAEALPQYDGNMPVDYDHEEQVRSVYRPMAGTTAVENSAPLDNNAPLTGYDRDTYSYDRDSALYDLDDTNHQSLKLYEERLIANKTRAKTGEVAVGKRVETETAKVSVPIEKERVVIERTAGAGTAVTPGDRAFQDGEVARVEVYEETPDIRKEAFVREEVNIRKEVDRDTVNAEETLRREELNVDTQGNPVVDKGVDSRRNSERV